MTSSDSSLQPEPSRFDVTPRVLSDDEYIAVLDDSDMLASATVALHSDRLVTQRCIQCAAALLGIDLRSVSVSSMPGHSVRAKRASSLASRASALLHRRSARLAGSSG